MEGQYERVSRQSRKLLYSVPAAMPLSSAKFLQRRALSGGPRPRLTLTSSGSNMATSAPDTPAAAPAVRKASSTAASSPHVAADPGNTHSSQTIASGKLSRTLSQLFGFARGLCRLAQRRQRQMLVTTGPIGSPCEIASSGLFPTGPAQPSYRTST